jgi:hypothetical protein
LSLRRVGALEDGDDFRGDAPVEADVLLERIENSAAQRLGLGCVLRSGTGERKRRYSRA